MKFLLSGIIWINAMVFSLAAFSGSKLEISTEFPNYATNDRIKQSDGAWSSTGNLTVDIRPKDELEEKIYVVIGVFALKSNAIKFTQYAKNNNFSSNFSLNPTNNFYYVYLFSTLNMEEAKEERNKIMNATNLFPGIWVFKYKKQAAESELVAQVKKEPVSQDSVLSNSAKEKDAIGFHPVIEPIVEIKKEDDEYFIYPNVVDARSYREIKASVEVIDPARAKLIKTIDAHQLNLVKAPDNRDHSIQLIANPFGYRNVVHELQLTKINEDSLSSFVTMRGDTILVEFPMVRLRTGDVATMYSVFFQNDAAVMQSDSKYQLNSLLEMLKENLNYKIRIHGHTNGNRRGKIIKLQKENPDFFTISEENKRGTCSAKKLSEERAITIKRYLVANGIAEDRMEVKGWGGKKMLYDKNSVDAKKNVRVEIEILQD